MIEILKNRYEYLDQKYPVPGKVLRYLISGGSATLTSLLLIFVLTEFFTIWYVLSSVLAFLASVIVSFLLQKFWTFRNSSTAFMKKQIALFFSFASFNTVLNTCIVFFLVEYVLFHYVAAQVVSAALIAIMSFFVYKRLFKEPVI